MCSAFAPPRCKGGFGSRNGISLWYIIQTRNFFKFTLHACKSRSYLNSVERVGPRSSVHNFHLFPKQIRYFSSGSKGLFSEHWGFTPNKSFTTTNLSESRKKRTTAGVSHLFVPTTSKTCYRGSSHWGRTCGKA